MFAYAKPEQKQVPKNTIQKKEAEKKVATPNQTGIPDAMKTRFENLSGFSFDDVRVHYNSGKPAELQAFAYTQGNQVYIGSGQEKHLGHELGHVVQQKQGRVKATDYIEGSPVNTSSDLEREADTIVKMDVAQQSHNLQENPGGKPVGQYMKIIQLWHGDNVADLNTLRAQATNRMLNALHIPQGVIDSLLADATFAQNLQIHYIIPKELCTASQVYFSNSDLNHRGQNGIYLPSTIGLSYLFGRIAHNGSHPTYTNQVGINLATAKINRLASGTASNQDRTDIATEITNRRATLSGNQPNQVLA